MCESQKGACLNTRLWMRCVSLALIVALNACATQPRIEHGFAIKNLGKETISRVVIKYGAVMLPFCDPHCLPGRGDGGWSAQMDIEDYMDVTWVTSDGKSNSARVPVKAKIVDLSRFRRLFLEFDEKSLVVMQGAYFPNQSVVGWDKAPLFP